MSALCTSYSAFSDCSRIIALNNEGATSLAGGDMALAISTFLQALKKSKASLTNDEEQTREGREHYSHSYVFHRGDDNPFESREATRNQEQNGIRHEVIGSFSSKLIQFGIDQLMEAECFGLTCNDDNDDSYRHNQISNKASKRSTSVDYSTIEKAEHCEKNTSSITDSNLARRGFIYRKAIRVPSSYAHHVGFQHSEVILPSILIFNLAVAHHIWAMNKEVQPQEDGNAGPKLQKEHNESLWLSRKAAMLYELAIQLQERQVETEGHRPYSKLFFLSCINNLGNVHRLLGNIALSKKIYQQLLSKLMHLNYMEELYSNGMVPSDSNASISSTPTFSAGQAYAAFFLNIFESSVDNAPAA